MQRNLMTWCSSPWANGFFSSSLFENIACDLAVAVILGICVIHIYTQVACATTVIDLYGSYLLCYCH